jgi:hypothetical protein
MGGMSSSGWLLKHVEVDFILIVAKVLINKLNELFKYKYQNQSFFAKVEIVRILQLICFPKSCKVLIFYAYTKKNLHDFESKSKSKNVKLKRQNIQLLNPLSRIVSEAGDTQQFK